MSSRNSNKSASLRLLWIPGRRRSNPKGRFNTTNKQVSYTTRQKKSEVWSMGGSKAQQNLLQAEPICSLDCITAPSGATAVAISAQCLETHISPDTISETSALFSNQIGHQRQHSPDTPNSSTSTAPFNSPLQSPLEQNIHVITTSEQAPNISNTLVTTIAMPTKSDQHMPVIVTSTTTAAIMQENRFSLLAGTNALDIYSLPSPPKHIFNLQENLNSSPGTIVSPTTPSGSPHKINNESGNVSVSNTPVKKKHHNNNQGDVNSIESITEDNLSEKIPSGNLDWIDTMVPEQQDDAILPEQNKTKEGKHFEDQLDGVPMKKHATGEYVKEEEEKVVKCLYYTLMCCDCTIS